MTKHLVIVDSGHYDFQSMIKKNLIFFFLFENVFSRLVINSFGKPVSGNGKFWSREFDWIYNICPEASTTMRWADDWLLYDWLNEDLQKQYLFLWKGCALEVPGCHRRLTFAFWHLEKLTCLITSKLKCQAPRISWLGTFGLLIIILIPQPCLRA